MIARKYPDLFLLLEDFERDEKGRVRQVWLKKYLKNSRSTPFIESHYRFVAGRADSIPLPSDTYANILCRRTLHEFDNREKMVTEFDRILRPAGILIISETAPKHPGEIDPYCRHAYLPGDSIRSGFKNWAFLTIDSVVIKDYKMFIYRFQKHK
jgi:ubiquinone/menaquinone biosynthesis C-methylase UbiE